MNCSNTNCGRIAEKDSLCNIHYHRSIWLDNTNINNLGIVAFSKAIVPEWARNETADFQKEVFYNFFQMYSSDKTDKYDRLLAEIAFRGSAKTTGAKIILLYLCCFGLEKFIIYCSETNTMAVQDVFEVRRELTTNPYIETYFGKISSKAVKGNDGEWSRDAYLTATGVSVLARGVGQQVRSALRNSYRPTLAIINDMDSKNTVITEDSRKKAQSWYFNDMFNAVDDIDGKVFFNGTIIHEDSTPVTLEKNSKDSDPPGYWKVLKYAIMDVDDFHKALTYCKTSESSVELPPTQVISELEDGMEIAWKDRLSLKYILKKYSEAYQSNQVDGFYQEYFHVVVPPTAKQFTNVRYAYMRYFRHGGYNWLAVKFQEHQEEMVYPVKVFFGIDPASSTEAHAKYSVIAILMMNQHREVFYYHYSRGKYGLRDELHTTGSNSDIVCIDQSKVRRKGIVDEEIRLTKRFFPNGAQVETTQAQQHIYTEILRIMRLNNANHQVVSDKPVTNKIERDAEMLVPDFQTGSAYINYGMPELEQEFKSFPRGTTVDIIDAFYHARKIARPADNLSYTRIKKRRPEEEYETNMHLL